MWYFLSAIKSALDLQRICKSCGKKHIKRIHYTEEDARCESCGGKLVKEKPKK